MNSIRLLALCSILSLNTGCYEIFTAVKNYHQEGLREEAQKAAIEKARKAGVDVDKVRVKMDGNTTLKLNNVLVLGVDEDGSLTVTPILVGGSLQSNQ